MGIYGSVPLLLAHKPGRTIGVFWLNSSETLVEIATKAAVKVSAMLEYCSACSLKVLLQWFSDFLELRLIFQNGRCVGTHRK